MRSYRCPACATTFAIEPTVWRCTCGSPLDLSPLPPLPAGSVPVDEAQTSLWRFRAALPFDPGADGWRAVTLGEGGTPLVSAPEPAAARSDVNLKLDFLMPTLSYKDRGAAVLVTKAAEMGVTRLVADSSGNAGTAIAAYAARAGIAAEVFVPAAASAGKVAQLQAFGATVHQVAGTRLDAATAAVERVGDIAAFYASHVYNPLFLEGTKTFAYEVCQQLGGRLPGTVVVPAGNGTLLLGAALGFAELCPALGGRPPRLVAVQAQRCDPVAAAWEGREADLGAWTSTVAEGIAIPRPPRGDQMVAAIRASDGVCLTVTEDQILGARADLARGGIDVEPTSAAVWAAWSAWPGRTSTPGPVVVALTGAGSKAAQA